MSYAHGGPLSPSSLWATWNYLPLVLLALVGIAYARGRGRRSWRAQGSAVSFYAGLSVLALALVSPIDAAAESLFALHMTQHLLLMLVAAPLLALGRPGALLLAAAPSGVRARVARFGSRDAVRTLARWGRSPIFVWLLAAAVMWVWHLPSLYDAALENSGLHAIEHATFLGSSVMFWSVVLPHGSKGSMQAGQGVLFLSLAGVQSGALGALLTFARSPLYESHAALRERWGIEGLTLLEDQQLAGVVMWVPAGIVYMGAAAWLFLRWLRAMDSAEALAMESASVESHP